MYNGDATKELIYLIYDNYNKAMLVTYRTPAYNSHKAIFSTMASANKVVKNLNENSEGRYEVVQFRR